MFGILILGVTGVSAATLSAYNVDPGLVSVSGLSSGGSMSVQLGVAYSDTFKIGFGAFAGSPYDCARNQSYTDCMDNESPLITTPTANMKSWSGNEIGPVNNIESRKIYLQVGSADTTVGPNVVGQLNTQLSSFDNSANITYVTTSDAVHTFPTDFDASGNNACSDATSPYISNCNYDGAGAVLQWLHGTLNPRNTGTLSGTIVSFDQTGQYGAPGMDTTGYLYVPAACQGSSTICKLHVALHGCVQGYSQIGSTFIKNTGYTMWADTNDLIILFPQAIQDNKSYTIWGGKKLSNSNGCWDWLGWYGTNADQIGGVQMVAIVNQVNQITNGYQGSSSTPTAGSSKATTTSSPTGATSASSSAGSTGKLINKKQAILALCGLDLLILLFA